MRLNGRKVSVALVVAIGAFAGLALVADQQMLNAAPVTRIARSGDNAAETPEIRRIHAHFDSVLTELNARDVSSLSQVATAKRNQLVRTLTAYNARGVFPHNYDFASPTPYFIDRKTGTLCAVAYLLESTGRRDIVNRVAEADNNVWVAKLSGDSAFASWLDTQGITLDEAARIQVPYVGSPSESQTQTSQNTSRALTAGGALVTATALATTTYNVWGNRNGHSRLGNYTGLTSNLVLGSLGALMASQAQSSERAAKTVGVTSALVGTVGVALATRAILHRPRYLAAEREKENVRRANIDASISPIIPLDRNSGAGLSMAIRF